jgi:hypothetical protein
LRRSTWQPASANLTAQGNASGRNGIIKPSDNDSQTPQESWNEWRFEHIRVGDAAKSSGSNTKIYS